MPKWTPPTFWSLLVLFCCSTGVSFANSHVCGDALNPLSGSLHTPGFPGDYPSDVDCSWGILFNSTKQLTLTFHYFETHGTADQLRVYVRDPRYGEAFIQLYEAFGYCINSSAVCPPDIHISVLATEVLIKFQSDSGGIASGFNISYSITEPVDACRQAPCQNFAQCIGTDDDTNVTCDCPRGFTGSHCEDLTGETPILCGGLLSLPSGVIQSPGYPDSHLSDVKCVWILATDVDQDLLFLFSYSGFGVKECCTDVIVHSYENSSGWLPVVSRSEECHNGNVNCSCGNMQWFKGRYLYVTFETVNNSELSTFELSYNSIVAAITEMNGTDVQCGEIVEDPLNLVCGGHLTDNYGHMVSSGFPNDYCNSTSCTWTASFSSTRQVTLTFNVFNTEESSDEFKVFVSDPLYGDGLNLYKMSGLCLGDQECPPGAEISFLTTNLTLQFSSDEIISSVGFNISYRISDLSGACRNSPCENWAECVETDGGVNFTCHCPRGFSGPSCEIFTGETPMLCGGLLFSPSGSIKSPGFPSRYFDNAQCLWILAVEEANMQQFIFKYLTFDVEGTDFVHVYFLLDGGDWILNFSRSGRCVDGNETCSCSDQSFFLGHRFYVTFTSDGSGDGQGFEISYTSLDAISVGNGTVSSCQGPVDYSLLGCHTCLTESYEELSSSLFYDYCNNDNYIWSASFTTTKQVTLTFHVFNTVPGHEFRIHIQHPLYGDGVVDLYFISGLCLSDRECPPGAEISFLATNATFDFTTDEKVCSDEFNISYRTSDISGACLKSPCLNWGRCVEFNEGKNFTCDCTRGFTGEICEDFTGDSSLLCGGLLSSPYGTIQSPNFPSSYLVSSPCVWLLAVEEADMQQFLFNYLTFDVEDSDLVQVFSLLDGGEWVLNISRSGLCIDGNVSCPCTDQSYFLGHRFYVVFTSDDSTAGSRFEISYSSLDADLSDDGSISSCEDVMSDDLLHLICGGSLLNSHGSLLSPGFPSDYCNNTNCSWSTSFHTSQQVTLTFHEFNTEDADQFRIRVHDPLYGAGFVDLYSISGLCFSAQVCPPGVKISFLATEVVFDFFTSHFFSSAGFNISYTISSLTGVCRKGLCRNWGECIETDTGRNFTCQCSRGYNGSLCETSTGETPMFCGGLLPYPSGTFQSPGIQLPYYHCLWLMTASSSNEHLILFNYKRLHLDKANDSLQVFSLRNNSEWELSMLQLSGRCNNGEPTCPCNDTVTFLAHRFYAIFSSDNGTDSFEISYSSLRKPTVSYFFNSSLLGINMTCQGSHYRAPTNGQVLASDNGLQVTVTYDCNDGYNLMGSTNRTCMANGQWTGSLPQCYKVNTLPDLVVTFNGTSTLNMMYVEYQSPVSIPSPVNITSKFSQYIQWATIRLISGQNGDIIDLSVTGFPAALQLKNTSTHHFLEIRGNGSLSDYETVLSALQFHNNLSRPANVSANTRFVRITIYDAMNRSAEATVVVNVIPVNDPPFIRIDSNVTKYLVGSDQVLLIPPNAVVDDVDNILSEGVNVTLDVRQPGDILGINLELAGEIGVTVTATHDDEGLVTRLSIRGEATFRDYKRLLQSLYYTLSANSSRLNRANLTLTGVYEGADSSILLIIADSSLASIPVTITVIKVDPCPPLSCEELYAPLNGSKTGGESACDNITIFSCNDCFELVGSESRTCLNGSWTGSQPTCQIIDCVHLPSPGNGSIIGVEKSTCGHTVSFTCKECYNMTGSHSRTCQSDRTWSGSFPTCDLIYCPVLTKPTNGFVTITNGNRCGSAAFFQCEDGFGLLGSVYRDCREIGEWRGVQPSCHAIGNLTLNIMEAWTNVPLSPVILTIHVVDDMTVTFYGRVQAEDNALVISLPAEKQILITAAASGYLPTTVSFFIHFMADNFLPLYLQRQAEPLTANLPDDDLVVGWGNGLELLIPRGALSVPSGSRLKVMVTTVNVTASLLGVPQLFGISSSLEPLSLRFNLDAYAAVHIDIHNENDTAVDVQLLSPIYLYLDMPHPTVEYLLSWSHVDSFGLWEPAGSARVTNGSRLEVNLSQLGWWAVGLQWTDTSCMTVAVRYSSSMNSDLTPLAGSLVRVTGDEYSYSSIKGTDAAGLACVEQKSYSSSIVQVVNEHEEFNVDSGLIFVNSSNSSSCPAEERWLATTDTDTNCIRIDIIFADCGPLSTPTNGTKHGNGVLSVLGYVDRPAVALFECDIGFNLTGPSKRTCLRNGTWDGYQPSCELVYCVDLFDPQNGAKHGDVTSYGATVSFTCEVGYLLTVSPNRTCQADGEWSGDIAVCNPRDCGTFDSVENGRIVGNATTFRSILSFECITGYEVSGSSSVECQADGNWSSTNVQCNAVSCGRLDAIPNGRKFGDAGNTLGFTVHFECSFCYKLEGYPNRTCQANKQWSGTQPSCNRVYCSPLETPENGNKTGDDRRCSARVEFTCSTGYKLNGTDVRICREDGKWSGQQPTCELIQCPELSSPLNGVKEGNKTTVGSQVTFSCNHCFQMEPESHFNLTCLQEGQWNRQPPVCQLVHCPKLPYPDNGYGVSEGNSCGNSTQFTCNKNYGLVGSMRSECLPNGTWSNDPPICKVVDCGDPGTVPNGLPPIGNSTIVGSIVTFECEKCFKLNGSLSRICEENGLWSDSLPTCDLVHCPALSDPENGVKASMLTSCGSNVSYSCLVGYRFVGNRSRSCLENGIWTGSEPHCVDIDECASVPCQNGGTCINEVDRYTCFCTSSYEGDVCEIPTLRGSCAVQDCNAFIVKAESSFWCAGKSYIPEFLSPFCSFTSRLATSSHARNWARSAWGCLVRVTVTAIESIYGGFRSNVPSNSECQEFDRKAFSGQEECLSEDLCSTVFTQSDSLILVDVLEKSGVFRDRTVQQMSRLIDNCGKDKYENVRPLQEELERRGFVFCFTVANEAAAAAMIEFFKQFLAIVSASRGGGQGNNAGDVVALDNADEVCVISSSQPSRRSTGRLKRMTNNDTDPVATKPVVVAVRSNITAVVSQDSLCSEDNAAMTNFTGTLLCPVCGDGVLYLATEDCDDGNNASGDGCSPTCTIEDGFGCHTIPDEITRCELQVCGDGVRVPGEDCDTGPMPGCANCTLIPSFECFENDIFLQSVCSECGNGIVDSDEECDNGLSDSPDGCNSTCHILPFFNCYGNVTEPGFCRHIDIDLNTMDNTTRNLTVVYFRRRQTVFLVDSLTLDASEYGNKDWEKIKLTLPWSSSFFDEGLDFISSLDDAITAGRLTVPERMALSGAVSQMEDSDIPSGTKTLFVVRNSGQSVNLTHVLLALSYKHAGQPDYIHRLVLIEVLDVLGRSAPAIGVTVAYVGENINPPVIDIKQNSATFLEGSNDSVSVTQGSLNVSDADHEFYAMQSGRIRIIEAGSAERLQLVLRSSIIVISVKANGTVIELNGTGIPEVYAELFNNVSYFNWERNKPETTETVVQFEVSDGIHSVSATVLVTVVAINDPPLVNLGVGVSQNDMLQFTEQQDTGIHIVSLPHRLQLGDLENHLISSVSIALKSDPPNALDMYEFLYYLDGRPPDSLTYVADPSGKMVTFEGTASYEVYESVLIRIFYANTEDEPSVFLNGDMTTRIRRYIEFNVTDTGVPSASTVVVSYIDIVFVNDHAPTLTVRVSGTCTADTTSSILHERIRRDVGHEVSDESEQDPEERSDEQQTHEAPSVVSVEAVALVDGYVSAGSSLHIRFSHDTNMPPVLAKPHLHKVLTLSPRSLHVAPTVAAWKDNRTLVVLFPTLIAGDNGEVAGNNVTVSFVEPPEPCSGKRSCRNGVCHAGGKSCRVTGSYRVGHAHVNDVGSYTLLACCGLLLFTAIALLIMSTGWKRLLGLVPFDSTITGMHHKAQTLDSRVATRFRRSSRPISPKKKSVDDVC